MWRWTKEYRKMRMARAMFVICSFLLPVYGQASAQPSWDVIKTFHIGGQGSWDYLTLDPPTHRLFVTRTTHTMVIDSESGRTLADIPGQKNAHGVALATSA